MTQRDESVTPEAYTPASAEFILTAEQIGAMSRLLGRAERALLQISERRREDPMRFALCKLVVTGLGEPQSWVIEDDGTTRRATHQD